MTAPRRRDVRASRLPESEQRMPPAATRARLRAFGALGRARSGPLRYLVLGGAVLGSFAGLIAGIVAPSSGGGSDWLPIVVMFVCVPGAFVAGLAVGWSTFGLAASRTELPGTGRATRAVTLLLALPAYLVAGEVGAVGSALAAGSAPGDMAASALGITIVLLAGYLVIAPLSFAFARGDRSQPTTFGEAVRESRVAMGSPRDPSGTFWAAAFTVLWFLGSFFVVLVVLMGVQALAPGWYAEAVEGSLFVPVVLVAWLLVWLGGAAAAFWVARQASSRDR